MYKILAPTALDTIADRISVATANPSPFLLVGDPLPTVYWLLSGAATGGTIDITIGLVSLKIVTTAGQSAARVASAIVAAINSDPDLAAAGATAVRAGRRVLSNGADRGFTSNDSGIGLSTAELPSLSVGPAALLCLLLAAASVARFNRRNA
jgi:hypothetical protein